MDLTVKSISDIKALFSASQLTASVHEKNARILRNVLNDCGQEDFWVQFKIILNIILNVQKFTPYLDRSIYFLALFCVTLNFSKQQENDTDIPTDHPLVKKIITYLLESSEVANYTIRLRSCQLINRILEKFAGMELGQELFSSLQNTLLKRLNDPKSIIRQQAIILLYHLQDPTDPDDPIIPVLLEKTSDLCVKVRQLAVEKVALRKEVIPDVITHIRDVDVNVRLAAFQRLLKLPKYLKISDRRHILLCGLSAKRDKVEEYFQEFVYSWLECYSDIIAFLSSLRLDDSEKDIEETSDLFERILLIIFKDKQLAELSKTLPLSEEKLLPIESLNWETVSYWQRYVQHLNSNDAFDVELEKVIPDLIYFCKYIKNYILSIPKESTIVEFLEQQYIIKELFLIAKTYDFADLSNIKCLNSLVVDIIESTVLKTDVIEVIISCLENTIPNISERTEFVNDIISNILYPLNADECQKQQEEKDFEVAQFKVKINCLKQDLEDVVEKADYIGAERIKNQLIEAEESLKTLQEHKPEERVEKKSDILATVKCLDIAAAILLSPDVTHLTPYLRTLKDNFIQGLLMEDNDNVRVKALRCYALCCIVDKPTALTAIHIFSAHIFAYNTGAECDTETLLICITALIDLLDVYGTQLIAEPKSEQVTESMDEKHETIFMGGTSLTDLLQGLATLMDDEDSSIQERTAFGLCKLILTDRIRSSSLISRLVLKWCNPAIDKEVCGNLRLIIGKTLEQISPLAQHSEELKEAVLITVKMLLSAPPTSSLVDVDVDNIAKFMIALCKTTPESDRIQADLAIEICVEIIKNQVNQLHVLSKMLLMLDIPNEKLLIKDLMELCDEIKDNIRNRAVLRDITKFTNAFSVKVEDQDTEETEEESDEENVE